MRADLEARLPEAAFHGHLAPEALRALMLESDALLHTSQTDTFAEAVAEAMACALPVVVSNAGGPLCYVAHGHTGLVCSATPEAFAEALRALGGDPELWAYLSQGARTLAERCSWPELWRAVLDALDPSARLLVDRRSPRS
jgi:phosphatidylinositol alpha 1,6-mannosyltransferase